MPALWDYVVRLEREAKPREEVVLLASNKIILYDLIIRKVPEARDTMEMEQKLFHGTLSLYSLQLCNMKCRFCDIALTKYSKISIIFLLHITRTVSQNINCNR